MKQLLPIVLLAACCGPAPLAAEEGAANNSKKSGWMDPPPRPHVTTTSTEDPWSTKRIWAHFRTRAGIVQLCLVCMAAGLFILMRKFVGPELPRHRCLRDPREQDHPTKSGADFTS
jgi:hypothetical protein